MKTPRASLFSFSSFILLSKGKISLLFYLSRSDACFRIPYPFHKAQLVLEIGYSKQKDRLK